MARFETIPCENQLPFAGGTFDACFSSEVIEHLFDVPGWISEVHRVLVRGGLLLLTTPYHGWLKNVAIATLCFDRHFAPDGEHIRFFTKTSLARCLEEGGFRIEETRGIGRLYLLWKSMFVVARAR
jgi:2-polyprenyl-6-hydroxyphenyl methylase/3-demethylubiquinone-9 3-methyltransferase